MGKDDCFATKVTKENFCLYKMLLLQQVCSYAPALREVGMRETEVHKAKKKKIGQQPCPESQRTLQMLNGDKQNQVKVLPDLP